MFIKHLFICSKKYPNQMEKLAILLTKKKIQKNSYFKNIFLKIICHLFRFKYNLNDSSKLKQEKIILTKNDIDYIKKIIKFEIKPIYSRCVFDIIFKIPISRGIWTILISDT